MITLLYVLQTTFLFCLLIVGVGIYEQFKKQGQNTKDDELLERAKIKDAILIILIGMNEKLFLPQLQYKLLTCGINVSRPDLKVLLEEINQDFPGLTVDVPEPASPV